MPLSKALHTRMYTHTHTHTHTHTRISEHGSVARGGRLGWEAVVVLGVPAGNACSCRALKQVWAVIVNAAFPPVTSPQSIPSHITQTHPYSHITQLSPNHIPKSCPPVTSLVTSLIHTSSHIPQSHPSFTPPFISSNQIPR